MNKTYLILLSAEFERDKIIDFINKNPVFDFWFYTFPSSVFVRTNLNAIDIRNMVQKNFGMHYIFIVEITPSLNYSGWMPTNQVGLFPK